MVTFRRRLLIKTPVYESPGRNYETKTRIFKFPDNGYNKHKITCISVSLETYERLFLSIYLFLIAVR